MIRTLKIIRQYDDHDPVVLGRLEATGRVPSNVQLDIDQHWVAFQKQHPDSDSDFITYLARRGYKKLDDEDIDIVVG